MVKEAAVLPEGILETAKQYKAELIVMGGITPRRRAWPCICPGVLAGKYPQGPLPGA